MSSASSRHEKLADIIDQMMGSMKISSDNVVYKPWPEMKVADDTLMIEDDAASVATLPTMVGAAGSRVDGRPHVRGADEPQQCSCPSWSDTVTGLERCLRLATRLLLVALLVYVAWNLVATVQKDIEYKVRDFMIGSRLSKSFL